MVKSWLIDNYKETDMKFVTFKQNIELFNFCAIDV